MHNCFASFRAARSISNSGQRPNLVYYFLLPTLFFSASQMPNLENVASNDAQGDVNEELAEIASRCRLNGDRLLVPRCRFDPGVTRCKNKEIFDAQWCGSKLTRSACAPNKAQVNAVIAAYVADYGDVRRIFKCVVVTGIITYHTLAIGCAQCMGLSQQGAAFFLLPPLHHFCQE